MDQSKDHMEKVFSDITTLESKIIQVREEAVQALDVEMESLVEETVRFDVCSQEALINKTDHDIEVLDIGDKSIQHLMTNAESVGEVSTMAMFGNANQTWTNFHD